MLSMPLRASLRWRLVDHAPDVPVTGVPSRASLGAGRYTRLPNDSTATMRHSTRLHSQLARSFRRLQLAALPAGYYSPPLRSRRAALVI